MSLKISDRIHRSINFFLVGAIYSLIFPILSSWLTHLLPIVVFIHFLAVGFFWIVTDMLVQILLSYWNSIIIPIGIWGLWVLYLATWIFLHSWIWIFDPLFGFLIGKFTVVNLTILVGLPTILVYVLVLLGSTLATLTKKGSYIYTGLAILCLLSAYSILEIYPVSETFHPLKPSERVNYRSEARDYTRVLYPFSIPITDYLKNYYLLRPDLSNGEYVIVTVLDAFRQDRLGAKRYGIKLTPELDKLSKQGVLFGNYYVQGSWTKPSTASLFTGRYVRNHGTFLGHWKDRHDGFRGEHVLPSKFETLAERFSSVGFRNWGAGMTSHLSERYGFEQGFERWVFPGNGYQNDFIALRKKLYWLVKEAPERAFIYLHIKGPHHPYKLAYNSMNDYFWRQSPYYSEGGRVEIPGRYFFKSPHLARKIELGKISLTKEEIQFLRLLYDITLSYYDRQFIGQLKTSLKKLNAFQTSLLAFTGDHGEGLMEHGHYGHGLSLYQENIHTPLLMKFPPESRITKKRFERPMEAIDLTATLLDYVSAKKKNIEGNSVLPVLKGERKLDDKFKYAFSELTKLRWISQAAVINPPWKYIYNYTKGSGKLFNLQQDPGERSPVKINLSKRESLKNKIFTELGSDTHINYRAPLKSITPQEKNNLIGLGYLGQ